MVFCPAEYLYVFYLPYFAVHDLVIRMSYLSLRSIDKRHHRKEEGFCGGKSSLKFKWGESSRHYTPACGRQKLNEYKARVVFQWTIRGHKGMAAFQMGHTGNVSEVVHVAEQVLHKKDVL